MNSEIEQIQNELRLLYKNSKMETVQLFSGIQLSFITLKEDNLQIHHKPFENILEINYCKNGRVGWRMGNGNNVYLGAGDFSLHTMDFCSNSVMSLPNGFYEGLIIHIDLHELSINPPELLVGANITGELLYKKFCENCTFTSLAGNEQTDKIFSAFYNQPQNLKLPYQRLKTLELLLYLSNMETDSKKFLTEYQSEQIEIVRTIHEQLTNHIEQRFTIEELSRQYLINPTTLKAVFKSVYGNSIAAHIKEHRIEKAAKLLRESDFSVAEIAQLVGYDSQSKFTAAFKGYYNVLPKDYRRG